MRLERGKQFQWQSSQRWKTGHLLCGLFLVSPEAYDPNISAFSVFWSELVFVATLEHLDCLCFSQLSWSLLEECGRWWDRGGKTWIHNGKETQNDALWKWDDDEWWLGDQKEELSTREGKWEVMCQRLPASVKNNCTCDSRTWPFSGQPAQAIPLSMWCQVFCFDGTVSADYSGRLRMWPTHIFRHSGKRNTVPQT